jgi:hypothetical protein
LAISDASTPVGRPEVESDAEDVPGAHPGAGEDEHPVLGHRVAELVDDRPDGLGAAVDDRAAAERDHVQPRQQPDDRAVGLAHELAVQEGLAREYRRHVLDGESGF